MSTELVSVIIPTKNSAVTLGACLESVRNQSYKNTEIVVVDNGSVDKTKDLAYSYTNKVFDRGPERSAQRNFGVSQSSGDYVLIIDSDMVLSPGVIAACLERFHSRATTHGVVIPEQSFGEGFWAQCKKLERSFYVGVGWMEAARIFRKEIFDKVGGYDEQNTGTEDYDLPQRIQALFGENSIARITDLIFHNEQKISLVKSCRKKYYYAQRVGRYKSVAANQVNFEKQSSPLARYKLFFSKPQKLLNDPVVGMGMIFMKTCELLAGALGFLRGVMIKDR